MSNYHCSLLLKYNLDILPIDNYSEKKKIARKIQATSISSKATGNITLVHFT